MFVFTFLLVYRVYSLVRRRLNISAHDYVLELTFRIALHEDANENNSKSCLPTCCSKISREFRSFNRESFEANASAKRTFHLSTAAAEKKEWQNNSI